MSDLDTHLIDDAFAELRTDVATRMAPVPLSTVVAGARRRRRIQGTTVAAVTALLVAVPVVGYTMARHQGPAVPRPASSGCTVSVLRIPGNSTIRVMVREVTMDPTGRYVVADVFVIRGFDSDAAGGTLQGGFDAIVEWDNGRPTVVRIPAGTQVYPPIAVNRQGTIVGSRSGDDGRGWVVRDGVFSTLPAIGDMKMTPVAIDDRGDIVGTALDLNANPAGGTPLTVMWPADRPGTLRHLAPIDNTSPWGIGDDGTIVTSTDRDVLEYWNLNGGTVHQVPVPDGYHWGPFGSMQGGWLAGTVFPLASGQPMQGAIWRLGSDSPVLVGPNTELESVSSAGDATGITALHADPSEPPNVSPNRPVPFLYRDGALHLLPMPNGATGNAQAISDDGSTIVGATSDDHVLLWHC